MLVFTMKVGEAITISDDIRVVTAETAPYRHQFRCWLCKYEGVLEFEPAFREESGIEASQRIGNETHFRQLKMAAKRKLLQPD
jgi:hypothetical protein